MHFILRNAGNFSPTYLAAVQNLRVAVGSLTDFKEIEAEFERFFSKFTTVYDVWGHFEEYSLKQPQCFVFNYFLF